MYGLGEAVSKGFDIAPNTILDTIEHLWSPIKAKQDVPTKHQHVSQIYIASKYGTHHYVGEID